MAIFLNYSISRCHHRPSGLLACPYCSRPFNPPFRPDGVHAIDSQRVHRSNAQRCDGCGKLFAVLVVDWDLAGYPA